MSLEKGVGEEKDSARGRDSGGGGGEDGGCCRGCGRTLILDMEDIELCLDCLAFGRDLPFKIGAFVFAGCWDLEGADGFDDKGFAVIRCSMKSRWRMNSAIGMLITTGSTVIGRNWEL